MKNKFIKPTILMLICAITAIIGQNFSFATNVNLSNSMIGAALPDFLSYFHEWLVSKLGVKNPDTVIMILAIVLGLIAISVLIIVIVLFVKIRGYNSVNKVHKKEIEKIKEDKRKHDNVLKKVVRRDRQREKEKMKAVEQNDKEKPNKTITEKEVISAPLPLETEQKKSKKEEKEEKKRADAEKANLIVQEKAQKKAEKDAQEKAKKEAKNSKNIKPATEENLLSAAPIESANTELSNKVNIEKLSANEFDFDESFMSDINDIAPLEIEEQSIDTQNDVDDISEFVIETKECSVTHVEENEYSDEFDIELSEKVPTDEYQNSQSYVTPEAVDSAEIEQPIEQSMDIISDEPLQASELFDLSTLDEPSIDISKGITDVPRNTEDLFDLSTFDNAEDSNIIEEKEIHELPTVPTVDFEKIEEIDIPEDVLVKENSYIITPEIAKLMAKIEKESQKQKTSTEEITDKIFGGKKIYIDRDSVIMPKSFESFLRQADESLKQIYDRVKNELLSYEDVHARMITGFEVFRRGCVQARFAIKGKTLYVYLRIEPSSVNGEIVKIKDYSKIKALEETPTEIRVSGKKKINIVVNIVSIMFEAQGITKKKEYVAQNFSEEFQRVEKGVIYSNNLLYKDN